MTRNLLILSTLLLLTSCNGGFEHGPTGNRAGTWEFVSNGERIYFTGTSVSGNPISASGGSGHMNMHMRVHGSGCVTCHGAEREGRRLWPQFWIEAPALTAEVLFAADEHDDDSDGHGDHESYDSNSLRRAITQGIDPAGQQLNDTMPRWNMNPADMNDLIAYLQQTHTHD